MQNLYPDAHALLCAVRCLENAAFGRPSRGVDLTAGAVAMTALTDVSNPHGCGSQSIVDAREALDMLHEGTLQVCNPRMQRHVLSLAEQLVREAYRRWPGELKRAVWTIRRDSDWRAQWGSDGGAHFFTLHSKARGERLSWRWMSITHHHEGTRERTPAGLRVLHEGEAHSALSAELSMISLAAMSGRPEGEGEGKGEGDSVGQAHLAER